jgi:hypothetical protein
MLAVVAAVVTPMAVDQVALVAQVAAGLEVRPVVQAQLILVVVAAALKLTQ